MNQSLLNDLYIQLLDEALDDLDSFSNLGGDNGIEGRMLRPFYMGAAKGRLIALRDYFNNRKNK